MADHHQQRPLLPLLFFICCCFCAAALVADAQLFVGFYDVLCPAAELIVDQEVRAAVAADPGLAASLLRLHFHDCFVQGCDGSVLVDSTAGNVAEKDAAPNLSLRGFDVIDRIKARLEEACFATVSCADVLAFAARDSVVLAGGLHYDVPAGRRDGNVSTAASTSGNLPAPTAGADELIRVFASKGLTEADLVVLSGAHTIGVSHCSSFSSRLYSFGPASSSGRDPSMDPSYLSQLMLQCPQQTTGGTVVPIDPITPTVFDGKYYGDVVANRGLFTSDQALLGKPSTAAKVTAYAANEGSFLADFGAAMVKMGAVGARTGGDGQIRLNCRVVN